MKYSSPLQSGPPLVHVHRVVRQVPTPILDSSLPDFCFRYWGVHLLSMVLELPPAPAALVLLGRWFAVFSARSAAAFLRMTVAGPPGGLGDAGRAVVEPVEAAFPGEVARCADCELD
jgi:hypothetical protein